MKEKHFLIYKGDYTGKLYARCNRVFGPQSQATTTNPKLVTCKKCLKIMEKKHD